MEGLRKAPVFLVAFALGGAVALPLSASPASGAHEDALTLGGHDGHVLMAHDGIAAQLHAVARVQDRQGQQLAAMSDQLGAPPPLEVTVTVWPHLRTSSEACPPDLACASITDRVHLYVSVARGGAWVGGIASSQVKVVRAVPLPTCTDHVSWSATDVPGIYRLVIRNICFPASAAEDHVFGLTITTPGGSAVAMVPIKIGARGPLPMTVT